MKAKHLIALTIVAAILVVLAVKTSHNGRTAPPAAIGQTLLPGLQVNDVAAIEITASEGAVQLERVEDRWICKEMYGYPADFSKVKAALLKLEQLKIGQVVRITEADRASLKMVPPPQDGAPQPDGGTLVELRSADGARLASLLIGAPHERSAAEGAGMGGGYPDGKYVSADAGSTVYLVSELLHEIVENALQWIDAELLNVQSSDVLDVTITGTNGQSLALSRASGSLRLPDLADDEEMDSTKLYGIDGALNYMRADGIADPALSDAQLGMENPALFVLRNKNDLVYTLRLGGAPADGSDKRYLRIAVAAAPQEASAPADAPAADDTGKDAAAAAAAERDKKVAELNAKLGGWTYLISSYKAQGMQHSRADLVKKKEAAKVEEEEENAEE